MPQKRTLTDRAIKALKAAPAGTRQDHVDAIVPGLAVRVTEKGSKSFILIARFKRGASPTRRAIGDVGALDLAEARDRAREWLALIAKGIDPAVAEEGERRSEERRQEQTFDVVAEEFLERHVKGKLRSESEIRRILDTHVKPRWKGRAIADIGRADVTALLDAVEAKSGARQADMTLAIVRKMLSRHETRHDGYRSPIIAGMGRYKVSEHKRERILGDHELRELWPVCQASGTFGAIVLFGLLTGQRREKLASIQWNDMRDGVWTIRREPREKSNAGSLRLPQMALDVIGAHPRIDGNPFIFAGRGGVAFNGWSKAKAALDAKLPNIAAWTVHDLRRTARSLMSRAGVRSHVAERVLGHAITGVEGVYDRHGYDEEKAQALEALSALISRILNPADNVIIPITKRA